MNGVERVGPFTPLELHIIDEPSQRVGCGRRSGDADLTVDDRVTLLLQRVVLERSGSVHVRADDIDELL